MDGRLDPIPEGSIYYWMYTQGLKQVPYSEVELALRNAGKIIRQKDQDNYWNGYHNSTLYRSDPLAVPKKPVCHAGKYPKLSEFELNPLRSLPVIKNRWVPCNKDNKPMIKWSNGCLPHSEAVAKKGMRYLAENLKGTRRIVIDFDIEHGDERDEGLAELARTFLESMRYCCHVRMDGDKIASMHVSFETDRLIPTTHHPEAKIDILGNAGNQLRYFKTKQWNGIKDTWLTDAEWNLITNYLIAKEVRHESQGDDCLGVS